MAEVLLITGGVDGGLYLLGGWGRVSVECVCLCVVEKSIGEEHWLNSIPHVEDTYVCDRYNPPQPPPQPTHPPSIPH